MKKQFLILAGSALILASCGSNENTDSANQQAQIDSIAAANAALQDEINKKKNDSAINATATAMADSIRAAEEAAAAASAKKGGTKKKATPPPAAPAPPPPPPPPPANPKEDRFKSNPDGSKTTDPNAPNKKADRFK